MRVFQCAIPGLDEVEEREDGTLFPKNFIAIPDKWIGEHAIRHNTALQKAVEAGAIGVQRDFIVSVALLEDWSLPGLNGNPDRWDFSKLSLDIVAWINDVTLTDYGACFIVKKKAWVGPQHGQGATTGTK